MIGASAFWSGFHQYILLIEMHESYYETRYTARKTGLAHSVPSWARTMDEDTHPRARRGSRRGSVRRAGPQIRPIERKACQLCRQVAVTLDEVLAECGDGVLQGLHVASVVPFPDASRLLVTLMSIDGRPGGA